MRKTLAALSLFFLTSLPALADSTETLEGRLVLQGPETAQVVSTGWQRPQACYCTVRETSDGRLVLRHQDCAPYYIELSSIGFTLTEDQTNAVNDGVATLIGADAGRCKFYPDELN